MFLAVHSSVGLFIGSEVANPWLAFLLGFVSHLVLDMIPHGDEGLGESKNPARKIKKLFLISSVDLLLVIALFFYLTNNSFIVLRPGILTGLAGSLLPDFIWGFHEISRDRVSGWISSNILSRLHDLLKIKVSLPVGLIIQLATLIIFVSLITR